VTLSLKGAKSPTRGRKLRSTGTKARAHASRAHEPRAELEKKLDTHIRELAEARRQLAEARGHLSDSLEQQTATSDVLRVISSSPGELKLVFQAMLANATRLCEAKFGTLFLCEGDGFRVASMHNAPPAYAEARTRMPIVRAYRDTALWRAANTKRAAQIADVTKI
jgi:hypothetical protein